MIKLSSPENNGNPIVVKYTGSTPYQYSNIQDIILHDGMPVSKLYPLDTTATGGAYDHVIGVIEMTLPFTGLDLVDNQTSPWWADFADIVIGASWSQFTITAVWLVFTDIEYISSITSGKLAMHVGVDVYVSNT